MLNLAELNRDIAIDTLVRTLYHIFMKSGKPKTITLTLVACSRCKHEWYPIKGRPLRCAACKSSYWARGQKEKYELTEEGNLEKI